jgi:hypothetical protein
MAKKPKKGDYYYSLTLEHELEDDEPLDKWEMTLPDEWFKAKFGFSGHDTGPFGLGAKGKLTRTLYWTANTTAAGFELHKLIMSKRRLKSMRGVKHSFQLMWEGE